MNTVRNSIADDTADGLVPLGMVVLPRTTESAIHQNEVELEIAHMVDHTRTSEVHLIGGVRVPTIWPNEGAEVFFVFGAGLDSDFGFLALLVVVFAFLVGLGWAFLGLVVAHQVTLLWKHERSLRIV